MIGNFQFLRHVITRASLALYALPVECFTEPPFPVPILTQTTLHNKKTGRPP
jgi:hypothetical protein